MRHEPEEQLPQKSSRDRGIGICRASMGLKGEGDKAHTGRQNPVEACGEFRISATAGTNANDAHTISTRFAPGRPGGDPHLTFAATAHLGECQNENLTVPGSIPSLGMLGWGGWCLVGAIAHAALGACVPHKLPSRRHGRRLRSDGMGGARAWRGKVHIVCARCLLLGRHLVAAIAQVRLLARTCSHLLALGPASGQVLQQCRELRLQTAMWRSAPNLQPAYDSMLASQLANSTPHASSHLRPRAHARSPR